MKPTENFTRNIYNLIGDENYLEAIRVLEIQKTTFPDSTAVHSLLAYCAWQLEDYHMACQEYLKLVELNPKKDRYKLSYAHSLYKTEQYYDALRATSSVQDPELKSEVLLLQSALRYAENDIQSSKSLLATSDQDDMDIMMDNACILFKEDRFEQALEKYENIKRTHGFIPEVAYCIALCHYRLNRLSEAIQNIAEIKSQAGRSHPELIRALAGDTVDFDAQGLISKARETFLVEGVNLLASIEYDQKHYKEALSALQELPGRSEEELDPITLHNLALCSMDENPADSFTKLSFLLGQELSPSETFRNLLLGYCKYDYTSLAADLLAEYSEMAATTMTSQTLDFLDALLLSAQSKEEAYRKFDTICKSKADIIRKLLRAVEEARKSNDDALQMQLTIEFEENVNEMIPILMNQAKIFWDLEKYQLVELLLMKYAEFCSDNRTWKMNLAHTYFMQQGKMANAINLYEPLVLGEESLVDVEAIVVANLCVAFVVTEQNTLADTIINRLTDDENMKKKIDEKAKLYHLSIIHLVIGTLYCANHNFEFGIEYIFKAFNPLHEKLSADTWFYAKKCLNELIRCLSNRSYVIEDPLFDKILMFLDNVDKNGKKIESIVDLSHSVEESKEHQTISFESRVIKSMLLKFYDF